MSYPHLAEEILNLDEILKNFICENEKSNKNESRKITKILKNKIFGSFKIFGTTHITSILIYYTININNLRFLGVDKIKLSLFIISIVSLTIFLIAILIIEIKVFFVNSNNNNGITSRPKIERNIRLISSINEISEESIACFEIKLKSKVDYLNENIKDLDTYYLPILVLFIIALSKYTLGIDFDTLENNISLLTGNLGFIASSTIVLRVLLTLYPKGLIRNYKSFLLLLNEAQLVRNNVSNST